MNVGGLFDGVGLLAYGLHLAGFEHAWLCERDQWRRSILAKRWPDVPIFDDVRAVGARSARSVDLVAGGFPCKGASTAGQRTGFDHPETVLWREMARAVRELRPRYVLVENVANILALHDGAMWGEVVGDLAALGFDIWWDCIPAGAVGAPHLRDRVFAVAAHPGRCGWSGEGRRRPVESEQRAARADLADAPDAERDRVREQPEPVPGGSGEAVPGRAREAAADATGERRNQGEPTSERPGLRANAGAARGVAVEWGPYEPAIRRWETVHGSAPEPLVRRVDDRSAAGVERSRLSALGDGVLVQAGWLVGRLIQDHAADVDRREAR